MTRRALLAMAAWAAALGCLGCLFPGEDNRPGLPTMSLLSPGPLDSVAWRDGDGPWQPLQNDFGVYRFEIHRPSFTLAFVCRSLGLGEVIQALAHEVSMIRVPCGDPLTGYHVPETTHRWQGAIRGVGPGAQVTISFGVYQIPMAAQVTGSAYSIDLRPIPYDVLAIAEAADGSTRVIVKHRVEVSGPGTLDLDFGGPEALIPQERPMPLPTASPGERLQTGVLITTTLGAKGVLLSRTLGQLPLLDPSRLSPDDVQEVWVRGAATDAVQLRQVSQRAAASSDPVLALPAPVTGASAVLAATTPVARPRVTFQPQSGPLFYQLVVAQLVPQDTLTWVVNTSAQLPVDRGAVELPDLSSVPGFPAELGPAPGVPLQLELTAVTSNRRMDIILDGRLPPGAGESTSYAKTVVSLPPR